MAPITRQQSQRLEEKDPNPFPFLQLPPEIRLRIYRCVLTRSQPILLHKPRPKLKPQLLALEEPPPGSTDHGRSYTIIYFDRPTWPPPESRVKATSEANHNPDPVTSLLRVSKLLYIESRSILYSENTFTLHVDTAVTTLTALHQRSRSLIRHVELYIPTNQDILDQFTDIVRLGLRYCWGLKTLVITLPVLFPGDEPPSGSPSRSVFANAFDILRWLPRATEVRLEGVRHDDIAKVVRDQQASRGLLNEVGQDGDGVMWVDIGHANEYMG